MGDSTPCREAGGGEAWKRPAYSRARCRGEAPGLAEAPRRDLGDGTEAERRRDGEEEQGRRMAELGTAMGHGVDACGTNVGAFRGRVGFLRGQASLAPLLRVIPGFLALPTRFLVGKLVIP